MRSRLPAIDAVMAAVAVLVATAGGHGKGPGQIREYLEAARGAWNFSGAVLVARRDSVVFSGGFGFADGAGRRRITPETRFSIGSVTKTFTAAAILQLSDTGRVDLDAPVSDYIPEYEPPGSAGVTIRRLLSHSAGVPDSGLDPASLGDPTKPQSPTQLLALIKDKPLDFAPGERTRYSNAGYVLLGLAIERVSGQTFRDYLSAHVLKPLGMTATTYGGDFSPGTDTARGLIEGPDGSPRETPVFDPSIGYSAGGLFSTVGDLWRWQRALEGSDVLSAAARNEMFRPGPGGFGLGWLVMDTWGRRDIAHGGGAPGYAAWIEIWPDDGLFVGVLSNCSRTPVGEIGRSLAACLFGERIQRPEERRVVPVETGLPAEVAGVYETKGKGIREIVRQGNALFVRREGGPLYPILPCGPDVFFFPNDWGTTIRFVRDEAGRVTGHVFHQLGLDACAEKIVR